MNPLRNNQLPKPRSVFLAVALILAAFIMFYYLLPGSVVLSGTAGSAIESGSAAYVVFYQHYFYGGYSYLAYPGSYPENPYWDISSVLIYGDASVKIFDNANFAGRSACLNSAQGALDINFNDRIRSFIVYAGKDCR
jgi:hypothetical protein